ncbi:MAG: MarC family protein [Betaproteobacteria bacterium HGW-Betaproteobacteria-11]|nr:MAG: MarC family protein [Betaproteobacteria bacterium HGW-Betaproteobacteria-11]
MGDFWLCFVPLFVAVDALGVLPAFLGLTQGVAPARVRQVLWQSLATALAVALAFLALGQAILALLGITVADFMVAGGLLLFVLAMGDLLVNDKLQRHVGPVDADSLGAVPLGVPLIVGPAVLTTIMLLANRYGFASTAMALVANIVIAGLIFAGAAPIRRVLGSVGERIVSKVAMLFLAAIAVMMVRRGVETWLAGGAG